MDYEFWNQEWKDRYDDRLKNIKDNPKLSYWNKRAHDFSMMRKSNDYDYGRKTCTVFTKILAHNSKVVDIGAGPGSFTVPFAQCFEWVTAIEPSTEMVNKLNENAKEANVTNYNVIKKLIQDIPENLLIEKYDLSIVSLVLWLFRDVWKEIERIESYSKKYCAIVTDITDFKNLRGQIKGDVDEFQVLYNMLLSKGRIANVDIINYRCERSIEDEIRCRKIMYEQYNQDLTLEIENEIAQSAIARAINGKCLVESRSAVIWWNKEEIVH